MYKTSFYNNKLAQEEQGKKKSQGIFYKNTNRTKSVDINILLNRVKLEEKNRIKNQIIFYCSTLFLLFLLGVLVAVFK